MNALKILSNKIDIDIKNIVEFSRGTDKAYQSIFHLKENKIYERSLNILINNFDAEFIKNILIINIKSTFKIRNDRNYERYKFGGHFVYLDTMNNIYKKDVFLFIKFSSSCGYFKYHNIYKIPVYNFLNINISNLEKRNKFFEKHFNKSINFYNNFID